MRKVADPFGMYGERTPSGVSFGPSRNLYESLFGRCSTATTTTKEKKKKAAPRKKFYYDGHGRRHRIVAKSKDAPEERSEALYLQGAYHVLAAAGKKIKGGGDDPRAKLKPWAKSGIRRDEFKDALDILGAKSIPELGISALWEDINVVDVVDNNKLLYLVLDRDMLKQALTNSLVCRRKFHQVNNVFMRYDVSLKGDAEKAAIISVRHAKLALSELLVEDIEDWEVEAVCHHISDLLGEHKSIGSSKVVQVDAFIAYLRGECNAGAPRANAGEKQAKSAARLEHFELEKIRSHPQNFIKSMETLQKKMNKMLTQANVLELPPAF